MKRFLLTNLILLSALRILACYFPDIHDYYLFSVYNRDLTTNFYDRCNQNWAAYTNGTVSSFDTDALINFACKKGDTQMIEYVKLLDTYLNISSSLSDPWDYPTKEQISQDGNRLRNIRAKAQAALRTRLRSQNALLVMRCNMMLEQHQANISFWNAWQEKLPNSVYRDMMRNIYAGALCHQNRQDEACEIFAEQGDMTSIRYCMYDSLSYAGIKKVYDHNPNSAALPWLIQTYVNDAQSTLSGSPYESESPYEQTALLPAYRKDITNFIALANRAASTTKVPALWKTAAAWLEFLYGDHQLAQKYIDEAITLDGTERMRDNARAIRFYITAANTTQNSREFDDYVATELQWLIAKDQQDCQDDCYTTHYSEVADRIVFEVLADKYDRWQRPDIAIALYGFIDQQRESHSTYAYYGSSNPHYSSYCFHALDHHTAKQLEDYLAFTQRQPKGRLETFLQSRVYRNADYLTDLIGTKYLTVCDWTNAINWLERVPLSFLDTQNICLYMDTRSYTIEQWRKSQLKEMPDTCGSTRLTHNLKIDFAREMNALEAKLTVASKKTVQQLSYDYAVRMFQASYMGDCWFLTRYGHSVGDTARAGERDFVAIARQHLERAAQSNDFLLKEKALYAIGYIPLDPWYEVVWDAEKCDYVKVIHPQSSQYRTLSALTDLYRTHPMSNYVSKCDVLKEFRDSRLTN